MEIYKLADKVPNEKRRRGRKEDDGDVSYDLVGDNVGARGELRITDFKQGVKNPNRVNVYVDGRFEFSLDVAQVVEYGLKIGMVLNKERLFELRQASEFGKMYQRTLEWVLLRPRSVRETRDYIARKFKMSISETLGPARRYGRTGAPSLLVSRESSSMDISELSETIISRLCTRGYLDDKRLAEWYVENRFVKKGVSRKRLKMELMKKGVTTEIIEEVLGGRDDEEEIRKMIARKRSKYDDPQKLIAYLCRQGVNDDLVRRLVEENEV